MKLIWKVGLAALLIAFLTVPALAREHGGGGTTHPSESYREPQAAPSQGVSERVTHQEIPVTKTVDKSSPTLMESSPQTGSRQVNPFKNFGDIKGESTDKDHKDW